MDPEHDDCSLVKACLRQDEEAWGRFEAMFRRPLVSMLVARGARHPEAEDLVSDLWLDLGGFGGPRPPLLARFAGTGSLKSWLSTVVLMRFIGQRRRKRVVVDLKETQAFDDLTERTASEGREPGAPDLGEAMRECLCRAWKNCPADLRLMLQLIHLESITQREIAFLWGWHESKVSRTLEAAMRRIRKDTLAHFAEFDPEAILGWKDFLDLGNHYESLFAHNPVADPSEGFRSVPLESVG
jgi:RNA polymerase sigma factor (sigma-70 family)